MNGLMSQKPLIVTVTGPSGAGKTVLSYLLRDEGNCETLISSTTRPKRQEETHGVDYYFETHDSFMALVDKGEMIEHVEYGGNEYGISAFEAQRAFGMGKTAVLVAEPHGVEQIRTYCQDRGWDVVNIFVNNPIELLVERLLVRFDRDLGQIDGLAVNTSATAIPQFIDRLVEASGVSEREMLLRQYHAASRGGDLSSLNDAQNAGLDKVYLSYAKRLSQVADFEKKNWVEPAYDGRHYYDFIFDRFENDNQREVFDQVMESIQPPRPVSRRSPRA